MNNKYKTPSSYLAFRYGKGNGYTGGANGWIHDHKGIPMCQGWEKFFVIIGEPVIRRWAASNFGVPDPENKTLEEIANILKRRAIPGRRPARRGRYKTKESK